MSNKYEFIAPCHFGLEAVCKREIADLGYEIVKVEDGKVTFAGDMEALVRANIFLRTTQRILLKVAEFKAVTFEELFQNVKKVPWEEYFPSDARFWVTKATSVKSKLFSPSDIQSIVKKAMVERMKEHYHINWFEEDGEDYPVRVIIYKDVVTIGLDTSGESLHKRGYRRMVSKAPIEETLAAALIKLTPWNKNRILVDPFCGSGTFPIEAAMMGANIAPGMHREFQAQRWENIVSPKFFARGFEEAESLVDLSVEMDIQGYDIDPQIVKAARENAKLNGLDNCRFIAGDVLKVLDDLTEKPDVIVLDPPRDGIHPKALPKILSYGVNRIVYVSCKATSLARDLEAFLAAGYRLEKACCVDQFCETVWTEAVALLVKE